MCARYLADQNKLVFIWESGTYANPSGNGVWMGLVTDYDFVENENVIQTRFVGQGNRNVGVFQTGPLDIEGTITIQPQHWRHLALAIGSVSQSAVSANFANVITEVNGGQRFSPWTSGVFNPWSSFTLEESRSSATANQNHKRTLRGAVINTYSLNINQGEPITEELGIVAQIGSWFSGATTSVTAGSNRPYLWSDATWSLPGGTTQESVKSFTFSVNNNFTMPHYVNGSRYAQVGFPGNRDYSIEVTQDLDSVMVGSLWDTYFKGGSIFNAVLDVNYSDGVIGSHRLQVTFSGCKIIEMDSPATSEDINELNYTVVPGSVSAVAYDRYSYLFF